MKIQFLPTSTWGKWSIWMTLAFFLFIASFFIAVAIINPAGKHYQHFFDNLWLAIPLLLAATSGTAAFVTGLIGMIFKRERAILVLTSSILGLLVTIFWLGELINGL